MDFNDTHELNSWLIRQSAKLKKAQRLIGSVTEVEKGILELEGIVREYVERVNDGAIFEKVSGFEETVFHAQELLAAAYVTQGQYDAALFLHRYVAETVQSILRNRHRNREELKDIRDSDIYHLTKTALFLVDFSRVMSAQGNLEPALQLLNEAIGLSDSWYLNVKYPELGRMIDEQLDVLAG
jgi:ferritin